MLFKIYSNQLVATLFLLIISQTAISSMFEGNCGENTFQVKILNGSDLYDRIMKFYYKEKNKKHRLLYQTDSGVFFHITCIKNKQKAPVILFQEHCFGNGCPEAVYGVVDPSTKKLLLNPSDSPKGNIKKVKKLLGYFPPFLGEGDEVSFCCSKAQNKTQK